MKTDKKLEIYETQIDNLILLTAQATEYAHLSKQKGDWFDRIAVKITDTVKLQKKTLLKQLYLDLN